MNGVKYLAAFVLGAAAGSAATWYIIKTKYEQLAQEEIDDVREFYRAKSVDTEEGEEMSTSKVNEEGVPLENLKKAEMARDKGDIMEYAAQLNKTGYKNYTNTEDVAAPEVIPPDEYGEDEDYAQIELTYYADCMLADSLDELVEDVEGTVGFRSLTHFGEWEDDSVYVRNDRLQSYFQIIKDERKYSEVAKSKPRHTEVE